MTAEDLKSFELEVVKHFNAGKIRAPIHLSDGNENELIEIFKDVKPGDWVATQWRSHFHCLLKGVPPDELMRDIIAGRSITLCYPEYRVISSAIVGGVLPIALGIAWSIKHKGEKDYVWAFIGDMTAMGGMFHEVKRYAHGHNLPIRFIVEDNGKSVCTETKPTWGRPSGNGGQVRHYGYTLNFPHSGAGKRIEF
jgi:pyruvate dehydrogenase E1 component alpha subunit